MARCIFENLSTSQAEELAHWYEGQGEQDADIWFDAQGIEGLKAPFADCGRKGGFMQITGMGDVIVHCR